jgi:hypothetical protein
VRELQVPRQIRNNAASASVRPNGVARLPLGNRPSALHTELHSAVIF